MRETAFFGKSEEKIIAWMFYPYPFFLPPYVQKALENGLPACEPEHHDEIITMFP